MKGALPPPPFAGWFANDLARADVGERLGGVLVFAYAAMGALSLLAFSFELRRVGLQRAIVWRYVEPAVIGVAFLIVAANFWYRMKRLPGSDGARRG